MMRLRLAILTSVVLVLATASNAFAWDFSCSPRTETEVQTSLPPNVLTMLDRSGSMDEAASANTCRVCEDSSGNYFEVASASECPYTTPWSFTQTQSIPTDNTVSGYTYNMTFSGVPAASPTGFELALDLSGDFGSRCERAYIFVDGDYLDTFNPRYRGRSVSANCRTRSNTWMVDPSYAADGTVNITIRTTPDGVCGRGDGVDAYCPNNSADVTLTNDSLTYLGSQTWSDPCGSQSKWQAAVSAMDALTADVQASTPQTAYMGLALFHDDATADVTNDCAPSNHDPIMSTLNGTGPGGGTPTGLALAVAANSSCIQDAGRDTRVQEKSVPQDATNSGYDYDFTVTGLAPQPTDFDIQLDLWGDYSDPCEFAEISVDGVDLGSVTGDSDCNTAPFTGTFTVPASLASDGQLDIVVHNRAYTDTSSSPACGVGDMAVDATCSDNRARVTVYAAGPPQGAATILITDGQPTKDYDGRGAYEASVYEACQHRQQANVYVVGLGGGTDQDFDNILAAAGGTGECVDTNGVPVDPCDDPANWDTLRNQCTGAYQTSDRNGMLAALASITAEIACTFPVSLLNSGQTEIPVDTSGEYPYVSIEAYKPSTNETISIPYANGPNATTPGEGWVFASAEHKQVRLTDSYCGQIQTRTFTKVATTLACLCQQTPGAMCDVPDYQARGQCPTGTWQCSEGVDWCQAETSCCVAGAACTVDGAVGACAQGHIVCDGSPMGTCQADNTPQPEVCDGIDNDCDGEIDEIADSCTVPGATGRCAAGRKSCDSSTGVVSCNPLYGPMPELCNGIDDDCDGAVDNIVSSWKKSDFAGMSIPSQYTGVACNLRDACMCPGGVSDDNAGSTYEDYLAAWDPVCQCGEGLAPASTASDNGGQPPAGPSGAARTPALAGCTTASTGGGEVPVPIALLLGTFLFGWIRRRRF